MQRTRTSCLYPTATTDQNKNVIVVIGLEHAIELGLTQRWYRTFVMMTKDDLEFLTDFLRFINSTWYTSSGTTTTH